MICATLIWMFDILKIIQNKQILLQVIEVEFIESVPLIAIIYVELRC